MDSVHGTQERRASRQCWECLKRRLVCDYTLPHCKKCLVKGKECPGYEAQKPLQWVEPGKITSRKRTKPSKKSELVMIQGMLPIQSNSSTSDSLRSGGNEKGGEQSREELINTYQRALAGVRCPADIDRIVELCDRDSIEEIVSKGLHEEAAKHLKLEKDPMKGLQRILRFMRMENLPSYNLQSEASEVVQAVNYFNTRVIPENTGPGSVLVPNPQIMFFPMSALHLLTPATHSSFVCIALMHYIMRLPSGASEQAFKDEGPKIWQYRGEAIRELSRRVADQRTMYSLATITSVVVFLTNELHAQTLPNWRTHIDVLMRIIQIRGGAMELYRIYHMRPTIVLLHLVIVSSNSTSPANDQIVLAPTLKEQLDNAEELYHEIFPYCLCPPSVFFFIIRISHLRREASQRLVEGSDMTDLRTSATKLLSELEAFSVKDWAQPGAAYGDWLTIGSSYKHAVAIYCIMSLGALALLPNTPQIMGRLERHSDLLATHLRTALSASRINKFTAWSMIMVGVDAGYRGEARRNWVNESCVKLAKILGTNSPLNLKTVLRRYWNGGKVGWEQCFNQPCAFMF